MKANENYISLETGKLLKDCGLESEYIYYSYGVRSGVNELSNRLYKSGKNNKRNSRLSDIIPVYPAFTWWEILRKYPEQFFGGELISKGSLGDSNCRVYTRDLLYLLQKNQFNEADMYFRIYCILINNKGE